MQQIKIVYVTSSNNRSFGALGERIAENYLKKLGYVILAKNLYCRWGEIDIVARKFDCTVFIEVKSVHSQSSCSAVDLFNYKKRSHLVRAISLILHKYRLKVWRLDLICLTFENRKIWIEHYKNVLAF